MAISAWPSSSRAPYPSMLYFRIHGKERRSPFEDLQNGTGTKKAGYEKIRFCAEQAKRDGLQYFGVDTCCIDKSNSAELVEAINSMFRWYRMSTTCYVYLLDVSRTSVNINNLAWELPFLKSKWFARGWALQDLITPILIKFFYRESKRRRDSEGMANAFKRLEEEIDKFNKCLQDLRVSDPCDDTTHIEDTRGGLLEGSYN
ncbi:hypothetical protein DL95DRAFT_474749 [Leptodontidium sp. 2 PMI_412]|nr:hypothetical protein DL95DRAFT_474749 [Leptodontidium sp. 2 PMI_412]